MWGTLAVGLFNVDLGLFTGHGFGQVGVQILGIIVYGLFAVVSAFIAWSIIGAIFGGIRVTEGEETEGLDIGEHGMQAYPDFAASAK
jgi:Amt family ammonium transporter